jgi:hypothetical protein
MQISANTLLQVAQQALAAKPSAVKQPATFEPMNFAPEAPKPSSPAETPARPLPPGSQVDIRV